MLGGKIKSKLIFISLLTLCALTCRADTHYISLTGTNDAAGGYTNWAGAATNMQWAVDASSSSDTILVSNGTYYLTNQLYFGATRFSSTLRSMNGRDVTIIDGGFPNITNRCIIFVGALNTLDGFTIRNGFTTNSAWNEGGGGIYANRTKIVNCRIINNVTSNATSQGGGGGILAFGNGCIVTNCDIIGNIAYGSGGGLWSQESGNVVLMSGCNVISNQIPGASGHGAGVFIDSNSSISNCVIAYNSATNSFSGGVTMYNNAIMRNSLIFGNSAKTVGGIYLYSGRAGLGPNQVENCAIVSNYASSTAGGIYVRNSVRTNHIENCVVYYNTAGDGVNSNLYFFASDGAFECLNTCLAPTSSIPYEYDGVPLNNTGNIESDPRLVNYPAGNCRLAAGSPCVNAGTNRAWMTGAVDLDGRMRMRYGTVDMGAYEAIYGGTIFTGH